MRYVIFRLVFKVMIQQLISVVWVFKDLMIWFIMQLRIPIQPNVPFPVQDIQFLGKIDNNNDNPRIEKKKRNNF